jgi:hypothetical protein
MNNPNRSAGVCGDDVTLSNVFEDAGNGGDVTLSNVFEDAGNGGDVTLSDVLEDVENGDDESDGCRTYYEA